MTLQRTPLFETHAASGAKLVDFGGWEMPLHYGSQLAEHHAVRTDAGMFDVSHMCAVDVSGAVPKSFLRRLIAECEARGYRQMIAVIGDSANAGSIGVHTRCGFQMIGTHPSVGLKFGRWLDTVMMQRALGEGATTVPGDQA